MAPLLVPHIDQFQEQVQNYLCLKSEVQQIVWISQSLPIWGHMQIHMMLLSSIFKALEFGQKL